MKSTLPITAHKAPLLLTADELGQKLQVTAKTVRIWANEGRIKGAYRVKSHWRFNLEAVLNSMQTSSSDVEVAPSPSTKSEISTVSASDDRADSVGGTSTALSPLGYSHEHERKETA